MKSEIHVGDIGTEFRFRIADENGAFDPSEAETKQLLFLLPDGTTATRSASVEQSGSTWLLTYTTETPADDDFTSEAGKLKIQARLTYSDGSTFTSDIRSVDEDGSTLRVHPNLD